MSEIDYVVTDLKVSQKAIFDMQQLLNLLKSWSTSHKYKFSEKFYQDIEKEQEAKDIKIEVQCERTATDYLLYMIKFKLSVKDIKNVQITNHNRKLKLNAGTVELSFESFIKKDYMDKLENKPVLKFFRAIYDKFMIGDKLKDHEKELKDETYEFYNEVKSFLNLYKFEQD